MLADALPTEPPGKPKVLPKLSVNFQGEAAKRSNPTSKEQSLHGRRGAKRSYSTFKVRRGSREEILHVQGKRNPSKTVGAERGHQRADTLKP